MRKLDLWEAEILTGKRRGKARAVISVGIDCGRIKKEYCPYLKNQCEGARDEETRRVLCDRDFNDCCYYLSLANQEQRGEK